MPKEKEIKAKIIEILKNSEPINPLYEPNYEFWADQILELFAQRDKEILEEIEERIRTEEDTSWDDVQRNLLDFIKQKLKELKK